MGSAMKATFQTLLIYALVFCGAALADDREKFNNAYRDYWQHISANEIEPALAAAGDAFRYGTRLFGKKHINTANLAINYSKLLNDTGDYKQARKVLRGKLKVLEKHHGDNAADLVPVTIQIARAAKNPKTALKHLNRAAQLSKGYEDNRVEAQKNFDIVIILLSRGGSSLVKPFIDRAHEIYVERLQPNDIRLGLTSYHKARWAMSRGQHQEAVVYLLAALTAFKTPDGEPMSDLEGNVRRHLVQTYEVLEHRQQATEHLLVLGANQDWSDTPEPIYHSKAKVPAEAIEKRISGEVVLSFTIDEQGFVVDPRVAQSSLSIFNDAAVTMVQTFRYAPRFVDGKPVATDEVIYRERFVPVEPNQTAAASQTFERPPIREMILPDPTDRAKCLSGGIESYDSSCDGHRAFGRR